jgi:hypothetical protein
MTEECYHFVDRYKYEKNIKIDPWLWNHKHSFDLIQEKLDSIQET